MIQQNRESSDGSRCPSGMDVHDGNGAWDKKENPLISSFPLNLNIKPKLVLSCTERTISFDKFFFLTFLVRCGKSWITLCTGQRASVTVQ